MDLKEAGKVFCDHQVRMTWIRDDLVTFGCYIDNSWTIFSPLRFEEAFDAILRADKRAKEEKDVPVKGIDKTS